ncbi:hypothetical protein G6705_03015, partial [Polynucleobacter paneuropaeus]|nr:hypothetical protein [Polynucleobacter paneuropaeus]
INSVPAIFEAGRIWAKNKLSNKFTKFYENSEVPNYDVVVFLGSDHEYTCLDEDISGLKFKGNYYLVEAAIAKYGGIKSIAVRAHPNQAQDISYQKTLLPIMDLCTKCNVVFFGPSSNISSHELIKKSSIVMVEFSSIANDAILLGKEVDIIGNLDLKVILSEANKKYSMAQGELSGFIGEILSLYDDMYFMKFSLIQIIFVRLGIWIESLVNNFNYKSIKTVKNRIR